MGLGTNIMIPGKNIHDGRFNYRHWFRIIDVIKNFLPVWLLYLATKKTCFFLINITTYLETNNIVIYLGCND